MRERERERLEGEGRRVIGFSFSLAGNFLLETSARKLKGWGLKILRASDQVFLYPKTLAAGLMMWVPRYYRLPLNFFFLLLSLSSLRPGFSGKVSREMDIEILGIVALNIDVYTLFRWVVPKPRNLLWIRKTNYTADQHAANEIFHQSKAETRDATQLS